MAATNADNYRINTRLNAVVIEANPAVETLGLPHHVREHRGQDFMLVPHRPDTAKLLRNLGYEVPSPIVTRYDWAGETPFQSQITTAAMMTLQRRAYVLNEIGCVDADTEYLSPTGWRRIADYTEGQVAQYYPDTGQAEFVEPEEFVKLPCDMMVHIKTTRGIDQLLSPEHRMLLHAIGNPEKQEVVSALTLYERFLTNHKAAHKSEIGIKQAAIPATFSLPNNTSTLNLTDAQIRVMVAVKADGYFPGYKNGSVRIRVKKERKKERVRRLLGEAGIAFTETSKDFPTAKGFTTFCFIPPTQGKHYDATWWGCSEAQRKIIADEVLHWDGHVKGKRRAFFSRVEADADFIQFVFASLGFVTAKGDDLFPEATDYRLHIRNHGRPLGIYGVTNGGIKKENMWLEAAPDGFKYCFRVPSTFLLFRRNGCIFASGNTGKSLATLFAFDFLKKMRAATKMLVVAPLSTLSVVWEAEVFRRLPHLRAVVVHGSRKQRLRALEEDADIYIINHDGLKTMCTFIRKTRGMRVELNPELAERNDIDVIVLDELAIYRNCRTDRWRTAAALIKGRKWVWGLTGAPTPKAPTDAYGQVMLLTPQNAPSSFRSFSDQTMTQINQFKWLPKKDAMDTVYKMMQPSVRFERKDCVDLPPTTYSDREAELSATQKRAFKEMLSKLVTRQHGEKVIALNQGVKLSKLLQIVCGFIISNQGKPLDIEADSIDPDRVDTGNRMAVLEEVIDESQGKVIVFTPFKWSVKLIADALRSKQIPIKVVTGATSTTERNKIFNLFQHAQTPRVLVAHPKVMSHGLTLTAASTIVWYAPYPDLEIYEQANGRITRPSQKLDTHIVHLTSTATEQRVYRILRDRGNLQAALLSMFAAKNLDSYIKLI